MYPLLLIVVGLVVLVFGRRLAILGAAIGALLGVVLLRLFPNSADLMWQIIIVVGFGLAGFFLAAFARGIIDVVILVLGAIAGFEIVLSFLDLLKVDLGMVNWLLGVVGAVIGLMIIRRARRGSRDWGMIILASLVGALLVTRGLVIWLPSLQGTISTLIALVLAGAGYAYQGGFITKRQTTAAAPVAATAAVPVTPAVSTPAAPPATAPATPAEAEEPPAQEG